MTSREDEAKVLALLWLCGDVDKHEFNRACCTMGFYGTRADNALVNLKGRGIVSENTPRKRYG